MAACGVNRLKDESILVTMQQEPLHPGVLLRAEIKRRNLFVRHVAKQMPLNEAGMHRRFNGTFQMTPAFLQKVANVIPDLDIEKLTDAQRQYDAWQKRNALVDELSQMEEPLSDLEGGSPDSLARQQPPHPGDLLRAEIKRRKLMINRIARQFPVSKNRFHDRLNGKTTLQSDFLEKLATFIPDLDIQMLADAQRRYSLWHRRSEIRDQLAQLDDQA